MTSVLFVSNYIVFYSRSQLFIARSIYGTVTKVLRRSFENM